MKNLRDIFTNQSGLTMMELLLVIGILAAIMGALSMTVITMMRASPLNRDWEAILIQNQNAGHWISRDVQASRANIDYTTNFLTLTVPEWDNNTGGVVDKIISYQFENISGNQATLARYDNGEKSKVFEFIYYNPDDPEKNTRVNNYMPDNEEDPKFWTLTFQITTLTSDKVIVQKEYEAKQRVPPLYTE